jgi:bifunctional DNase/RNase
MTNLDLDLKSKSDWIEMFPFGLAMGASGAKPVMIFKDKQERKAFPVWLSPLDAGISVAQSDVYKTSSPHDTSLKILNELGVKVEKCLFREVRDNLQYVEIHISGSRKVKMIEAKAEDAISFCLRLGCKFFAQVDYIEKSRVLENKFSMGPVVMDTVPPKYLN